MQRKQKTVNNKCVVSKKVKIKSKYRYNIFSNILSNTNCKSIYNYSLSLDPDKNLDQQPDPDQNLDQQLDLEQQLDPDLSLDQ